MDIYFSNQTETKKDFVIVLLL